MDRMSFCIDHRFSKPFPVGLTIPRDWESRFGSYETATDLVQHALERRFDFLLVPQSIAPEFAHAEVAGSARPRTSLQGSPSHGGDSNARDLIWLGAPLLTVEGSAIVSTNAQGFDRKHVPFLRDQLTTMRATGGEQGRRSVFLEIELDVAAAISDSDEDDILEGFIVSLGKTFQSTEAHTASPLAKPSIDLETLRLFLAFVRDLGYDGVSLVLTGCLADLDFIDQPLSRTARLLQ
jgi:hypothetical protein